jgi:ribosomal protein S18 acetylase RimI-like enzyme
MIRLRSASEDDYGFLWELYRTAMKPYVEATWGWDEAWQAVYFRAHFDPAHYQIIQAEGVDVGVLSVETRPDSVYIARIAILPAYQRAGIGTVVICQVLGYAACQGLPVMLQVLKVNPARHLYERLDFVITGETETHYLMSTGAGSMPVYQPSPREQA